MRRFARISLLLATFATPTVAAELVPLDAFDAFASGKTLYYSQNGMPFGIERYLPGHKSIWQYADGTCVAGDYYARGDMICFLYEGDTQEQCWRFFKDGKTYSARAEGAQPQDDLSVMGRDQRPIPCKGPDVGV